MSGEIKPVGRISLGTSDWYQPFFTFMHKIASTPFGSWFYRLCVPSLDKVMLKLSRGRYTLTGLLAGLPVVVVNTVGARSRRPRLVPLLYISDRINPGTFALIASNWGQRHNPAWYYNLIANPKVRCSIAGQVGAYVAHEAAGLEYERLWQYATEIYLGYPLYLERVQRAGGRHIPIMVMSPLKS